MDNSVYFQNIVVCNEPFTESLLYYVTFTWNEENYIKLYRGICETTFQRCYENHKKSFNIPTYKNVTNTFTEYWPLKTNQFNRKYHGKSKGDISPQFRSQKMHVTPTYT